MYTNWKSPDNEERLTSACAESKSIMQICKTLGLAPKGGTILTVLITIIVSLI